MEPNSFLAHFTDQKTILVSKTADHMVVNARQTVVSDQDFADAIKIACDPVCNLDVAFSLADLLQSASHNQAKFEVERWTEFRGGSSLAPPSQEFRKQVLSRLAVALNNSLCE